MTRCVIVIIICLLSFFQAKSQPLVSDVSKTLEDLFERILKADDSGRISLNDSVRLIINNYVHTDSVMNHRFDNLRFLGQIDSPDGNIKIITWNIPLRTGENRYYLHIIRKDKKTDRKTIYSLEGKNRETGPLTDKTYTSDDWYGALYYAIQPFKIKREKLYMLLGLDTDNLNLSRKIIEVITFNEKDELIFGRDCLLKEGKKKYREVIEYSADGMVSLRFNTRKLIVFDNIDSFTRGHENTGESYGAGDSINGYRFKKDSWVFVSDIDIRSLK